MSVYFATRADNPNGPIKIGHSNNPKKRVKHLAQSHHGGMLMVGLFDGASREVESSFHKAMKDQQIEGEWFHQGRDLRKLMAPFRLNEPEFFPCQFTKKNTAVLGSPKTIDREIARGLLEQIMHGQSSVSVSLEIAFVQLNEINPFWSRRKVRALWNREASRVDYFQIRDMETVLGSIMGRVDRTRNNRTDGSGD